MCLYLSTTHNFATTTTDGLWSTATKLKLLIFDRIDVGGPPDYLLPASLPSHTDAL